eukprot:s2209_g13.t1
MIATVKRHDSSMQNSLAIHLLWRCMKAGVPLPLINEFKSFHSELGTLLIPGRAWCKAQLRKSEAANTAGPSMQA